MNITLKNVKRNARLSQETHCFSANVYVDGKKFTEICNAGHGGCDEYDASNEAVYELMKQINPNVVLTHDEVNRDDNQDWPYPDNWVETFSMTAASCFEAYVANLVNVFMFEKDIKNDLRHRFVCIKANSTDDDASIHLYPKKQFGDQAIDVVKSAIERHMEHEVEIINGWDFEDIKAAFELDAAA